MSCTMDANKPVYRFIVLFFNCLLTFGSYYCFDMPSVLQDQMQGAYQSNCSDDSLNELSVLGNRSNQSCCSDCLGMTPNQYNLLYAIYAWTNAVVVIGAGFLIDKLGNRVGLFIFSSLCVVGSSVFAAGSMFRGTSALLPLMLFGRLLFGAGNGSLTIVQNKITAFWFTGKELALAFGITLAFSRLGSVLNFFLTSHMRNHVGLVGTLWIGAGLCGLGFISAVVVSFLDRAGMKQLGQTDKIVVQSKNVRVTDVKYFSLSFWLLALTIMFFYNGVFPFVADASKFIKDKYKYNEDTSAYMAGAVYDVSMVISPFLGGVIDVFGKRGIVAISCSVLTIPVFGLLAFTYVHPIVSTLWLGFTYSVAAASLWPSIPLVVTQATVGTAMGLTTSLQMIGIGISNLIVGHILGKDSNVKQEELLSRWKYVMIYLLANTLACTVAAIFLNINDKRKGGVLNMNKKELNELLDSQKANEKASDSDTQESDIEEDNPDVKPLLQSSSSIN